MRDVLECARRKIVENGNAPSLRQTALRQMRSKNPGPAVDNIEAVHLAAIHRGQRLRPAMTRIVRRYVGQTAQRNDLPCGNGSAGRPVRSGKGPEVIVEAAVLFNDKDDVLNGSAAGLKPMGRVDRLSGLPKKRCCGPSHNENLGQDSNPDSNSASLPLVLRIERHGASR